MLLFHAFYRAHPLRKRSLKSKKLDKTVPKKKCIQYCVAGLHKL